MKIEGDYAALEFGEVRIDGQPLDPAPSQKLVNHSPDGFAWGYGGSGPAQLALAILLAAGISNGIALVLHQRFKAAFIATLAQGAPFNIDVDVARWVEENKPTIAMPTVAMPTEESL